jgi:hypothetical protein
MLPWPAEVPGAGQLLYGQYYPVSKVKATSTILGSRHALITPPGLARTQDHYDIQRHLANQRYYVQLGSAMQTPFGMLPKNYATNVSYDYGGRLQAAWLER